MIFRNPTFLEIEQIFEQLSSNKSRLSLEKEKNLKFMCNYFLIKPLYQYIKPFYFVQFIKRPWTIKLNRSIFNSHSLWAGFFKDATIYKFLFNSQEMGKFNNYRHNLQISKVF